MGSLHVTLGPCSTTEMNATAIKYILISAKTIDTILTIALFYCEWNNINDDDGIIYGMIMASIICRGILNSCAFKKNTNYALKYFGQALQLVPIGLLIAAIIICIIKNSIITLNVYFAIGVVVIWTITDSIMLFITMHENRVEQNESPC